jgi:hypothetical protein
MNLEPGRRGAVRMKTDLTVRGCVLVDPIASHAPSTSVSKYL